MVFVLRSKYPEPYDRNIQNHNTDVEFFFKIFLDASTNSIVLSEYTTSYCKNMDNTDTKHTSHKWGDYPSCDPDKLVPGHLWGTPVSKDNAVEVEMYRQSYRMQEESDQLKYKLEKNKREKIYNVCHRPISKEYENRMLEYEKQLFERLKDVPIPRDTDKQQRTEKQQQTQSHSEVEHNRLLEYLNYTSSRRRFS